MKKFGNIAIAAATTLLLMSCGGIGSHPATADGFAAIEKDLKSEFGENAYYTDLSISYDESIGNMFNVTVTKEPESLKMGEWTYIQAAWTQSSEVTLEIPEGSKAADFMFQLNDKINLKKLGELVELSIEKLKAEKNIESPTLDMAFIKFPDNGDMNKAEYTVMLEPKNGGTTFSFYYSLAGELRTMDY